MALIEIETYDQMLKLLQEYRNNYNEYMMLSLNALPKSPTIDGIPSQNATPKDEQLNKMIMRVDELNLRMSVIEEAVEVLKEVSQDYYRVIFYHYISIEHQMSLNRISSELFGFDDYINFWRGKWHKNALNALYEIIQHRRDCNRL